MDPESILERVKSKREELLRIAARHGARRVRVFGSVARGEAGAGSDVDLLVEMEPGKTLFDLMDFEEEASEILQAPVDAVSEGGVSPYLRERIFKEAAGL